MGRFFGLSELRVAGSSPAFPPLGGCSSVGRAAVKHPERNLSTSLKSEFIVGSILRVIA